MLKLKNPNARRFTRADEARIQRNALRYRRDAYRMLPGYRADAFDSVFFARQLEHVLEQEFDIEYPELRARAVIPVTMEADPADKTITYREYDRVGAAKLGADYSDDAPRVDIIGSETTGYIRPIIASYGYSIDEAEASQKTGRDLEGRRAEMAREAILREENTVAFVGDEERKLAGFLNFASVPISELIADGNGASTTFATKSPFQMLRDLNQVVNSIPELTNGIETADALCMPRKQLHLCATTPIGINPIDSVLSFFLKTNFYINSMDQIEVLNELVGAGEGGTDRMMAFRRNPLKVRLEIPQDFESLPAQAKGFEWIIPCHSRTAGVIWIKPYSAVYADGL